MPGPGVRRARRPEVRKQSRTSGRGKRSAACKNKLDHLQLQNVHLKRSRVYGEVRHIAACAGGDSRHLYLNFEVLIARRLKFFIAVD